MEQNDLRCRICYNTENNSLHKAREMNFGIRKEFEYIECSQCGCLQIKSYPEDIADYYPENYNSFTPFNTTPPKGLVKYLREQKLRYVLKDNWNLVGLLTSILFRKEGFEKKMAHGRIKLNSKILDVGSGKGALLVNLRNKGFKNLTGTDIFISDDIIYDQCLRIFKKDLSEIDDTYDFIMLNHSLEHMPDQDLVLKTLHRLIKPDGIVMIRIPVKSDFIWTQYGVNWGSLEAPRHYYLHTEKSISVLCQRTNFRLEKVTYDSGIYQFYTSEQYKRDIHLRADNSFYVNPEKSIFSREDIKRFKKHTKLLNKKRQGDCACFYLSPF